MMLTITAQELEDIFRTTDPFTLEASVALQATYQDHTMGFLPPLDHIPHEQLQRMAIEVKDYTERCWRATTRLRDVKPVPATLYIPEFGL
ncbi:MAG: hypothetical protein AAF846_26895 [Chloroflexota bacterium]